MPQSLYKHSNSKHTQAMLIVVVFLLIITQAHGSRQQLLQTMGFQAWQEPTPQQITIQFNKLTSHYNKEAKSIPNSAQKYNEIIKAFQQLKKNNFESNFGQQGHRRNQQQGRNSNSRRNGNRWNQYQQYNYDSFNDLFGQDYQNQNRRNRDKGSGFYFRSKTYNPSGEQRQQVKLNIQELLRDLHWDFVTVNDQQHQSNQPIHMKLNFKQFIIWLMSNPQLIIAALLISIGLINLCTCCCCCCCKCRKNKDQKTHQSQQNQQKWQNHKRKLDLRQNKYYTKQNQKSRRHTYND